MRRVGHRIAAFSPSRPGSRRHRVIARWIAGAEISVAPDVFARRAGWIVAGAAAAGGMLAGVPGAAVGAAAAPVAGWAWLRRRAAARLDRIADAFPDACGGMADALRSGLSLRQAIELVASDGTPQPLSAELARVARDARLGTPLPEAVAAFARRCPIPGAELWAVACEVAVRTGADLGPILEGVVASARDRARLLRELHAATAQGRMTALVVAALPFAFLAIVGAGSHGEVRLLLHEPIGWALLAVGGSLETAGWLWIRAMVRAP